MRKSKNRRVNEQVETIQTETIFREFLREEGIRALMGVISREVDIYCGSSYQRRAEKVYRRAGSGRGRLYVDGQSVSVVRPRVRRQEKDGSEVEQELLSYQLGRNRKHLGPQILQMIEGGMSLRGLERMKKKGFSASTIQKIWVEESAKNVALLRERDLSQQSFFGLMIDGVFLNKELVVLVAVGFDIEGNKTVLDFVWGSSENYELCRDLLQRLVKRGFRSATQRLLAVLDGADALNKAVREVFPEVEIQRCWVHKERNLHTYLNKKDHGECSALMDRVRKSEGAKDGEAAYLDLKRFLMKKNQGAVLSLEEGGQDLLTFHRLNMPATLNTAFLSTNLIENVMRNYRRHTDRVTKWNGKSNQVDRWSATALLQAEEGFRKIRHHRDLPKLLAALGGPPPGARTRLRSGLSPSGC